jgi:hypothetical protein
MLGCSLSLPRGREWLHARTATPREFGNQVLISSHRKLLSSKVMVVNVAEKPGQDSGRQG